MILSIDYDTEAKDKQLQLNIWSKSTKKPDFVKVLNKDQINEKLSKVTPSLPNSFLPPAIRYISQKRDIVLLERPPTYAHLNFTNKALKHLNLSGNSANKLVIPIPWQRYVINIAPNGGIASLACFFAKEEIKSLTTDAMCLAPLPNFYTTGLMCLPQFNDIEIKSLNLIDAVSEAYTLIWNTGFNVDTVAAASCHTGNHLKTNPLIGDFDTWLHFYRKWASYSLEEVLTWDWVAVYDSFNTFKNSYIPTQSISLHDFMVDIYLASQ